MRVELLPLSFQDWEDVGDDPARYAKARALTPGVDDDVLRGVAGQMVALLHRTGATPPWSGFLAIDRTSDTIVGTCGFTSPPDTDGAVEIAYFTFPDFEGRGVASAMAAALVECAQSDSGVRRIVAHTLPEKNASARVLEKTGFAKTGDAVDPDAGPVWRWERDPR